MNKYSIFIIIKILITIEVDKQASHNLHNYKISLKISQNTFR